MRIRGRWTLEDVAGGPYRTIPVEVPPRAPGLGLTLRYDRDAGVLDLGLFDPNGFRGYSGSARSEVIITPTGATPGYHPGPLPAGTWLVLLGAYRLPPEGLEWELEVTVGPVAPPPPPSLPRRSPRPPRRDLPAPRGHRWWAVDLHAHTVHSDGTLTVAELADRARARGLDAVAVTDHNTTSHHPELPAASRWSGVTLIPGQEVTTRYGHANCLGSLPWVDFRAPPASWLETTRRHGGRMVLCHPLAGPLAWRTPLPDPPDLVEVWHPSTPLEWALQWWGGVGGIPVGGTPVGGSDLHHPGPYFDVGHPTTWVAVPEGGAVLDALAPGMVALSATPHGPLLLPVEDRLWAVDADGTVLVDGEGRTRPVRGDRSALVPTCAPHHLRTPTGAMVAVVP